MINPAHLRLAVVQRDVPIGDAAAGPPRLRRGERFLRGPVPLPWLIRAAQLPGRALHVGVALWFLAGMRGPRDLTIPTALSSDLGLDRYAVYRGLAALESAGLVVVARHPGRKPRVSIIVAPAEAPKEGS